MALIHFAQDKQTREEVFAYMQEYLDKYTLAKVYKGEDVSGIKDAVDIIKKVQSQLVAEFTEKKSVMKADRSV